jgi:multiple sugar transport system ATP-binding protein
MNFFNVDVAGANDGAANVVLPGGRTARVPLRGNSAPAASAELGVRPEHLTVVDPADPAAVLQGAIGIVEHLGNSTLVYVETPAGQLIVQGEGGLEAKTGRLVGLSLSESHTHVFGADGATL